MNLNHLAIFHAVAQETSVSRGAQRLMISQPAVSKQLLQFERNLGIKLFDRLPRGIRLTEAGELMFGHAKRIFSIRDEAVSAIEELRGLRRGRLRIGASTTIGVYLLPEVFVSFRRKYPEVRCHLEIAGSQIVESRLRDGDLDLGFTEAFSGTSDLDAQVFRHDELIAIARPRCSLARKRSVSVARLCAEPFVVRDTGSETRSFAERALEERGLRIKAVLSLGSTEAIKRAVAAGLGVAIVSRLSIGLELEARRVAVLRVAGLGMRRPLYRLRVRGSNSSATTTAFIEWMGQFDA